MLLEHFIDCFTVGNIITPTPINLIPVSFINKRHGILGLKMAWKDFLSENLK